MRSYTAIRRGAVGAGPPISQARGFARRVKRRVAFGVKDQVPSSAGAGFFVAVYLQICDKILTADVGITEDF
jgi:hypothetical protein